MRIAIDASSALPPRTGIGNYTADLVEALGELDAVNEYHIFLNSLRRPLPSRIGAWERDRTVLHRARIPGPWLHYLWKRRSWPALAWWTGEVDVVHAPASVLPPAGRAAQVVTIHDCYFMRHPEHCQRGGGLYLRETLPKRLPQCEAILCVSEATRQDVLEFFDVDPLRVLVARHGVDTRRFHPVRDEEKLAEVRRRLNLPTEFFLALGTSEPRKNLEGLVRALARFQKMVPDAPKLVCAGAAGFQTSALWREVKERGLTQSVLFPGFVRDEDLPALYSMALALVVPSHEEGFGMTVLEAMACGTPVIASDCSGLREAGGAAALYTPASDPERMAEAMRSLALSLIQRARLSREGLQHVQAYSWRDAARQTLAAYEMVERERKGKWL
jgi:glycosyltransferase involved in cell wall biosynthesis